MPQPKVVLITGASSGIGRETAALLARRGYWVFGTSRRPDAVRLISGVTLLPMDLTSSTSIQGCVDEVLARAGKIDILINNAGCTGPAAASEETPIDQVRAMFETNFFGVVELTNRVLPHLRQSGGAIINISSLVGETSGPPYFGFYAASKHAVEGWTEALRYELAPLGIRVVLIAPGYIQSSLRESKQPPAQPIDSYQAARQKSLLLDQFAIHHGREPEQVAYTVLKVLNHPSPTLRYPVGSDSFWLSVFRRILPFKLIERFLTWLYLDWKPDQPPTEEPTREDLGWLRYTLLHSPSTDRLLNTAGAVLITAFGLGVGMRLMNRWFWNKNGKD